MPFHVRLRRVPALPVCTEDQSTVTVRFASGVDGSGLGAARLRDVLKKCQRFSQAFPLDPSARGRDLAMDRELPRVRVPGAVHPKPWQAIVAVEHAMLIAIWNMLTTGTLYNDPGADFYTRLNPDKAKNRALDQLRKMGYDVTLNPLAEAG